MGLTTVFNVLQGIVAADSALKRRRSAQDAWTHQEASVDTARGVSQLGGGLAYAVHRVAAIASGVFKDSATLQSLRQVMQVSGGIGDGCFSLCYLFIAIWSGVELWHTYQFAKKCHLLGQPNDETIEAVFREVQEAVTKNPSLCQRLSLSNKVVELRLSPAQTNSGDGSLPPKEMTKEAKRSVLEKVRKKLAQSARVRVALLAASILGAIGVVILFSFPPLAIIGLALYLACAVLMLGADIHFLKRSWKQPPGKHNTVYLGVAATLATLSLVCAGTLSFGIVPMAVCGALYATQMGTIGYSLYRHRTWKPKEKTGGLEEKVEQTKRLSLSPPDVGHWAMCRGL